MFAKHVWSQTTHRTLFSVVGTLHRFFGHCLYTFTDGASGSQNRKNLSKERERAEV